MKSNIETIKALYQNFSKGDINAIKEKFATGDVLSINQHRSDFLEKAHDGPFWTAIWELRGR